MEKYIELEISGAANQRKDWNSRLNQMISQGNLEILSGSFTKASEESFSYSGLLYLPNNSTIPIEEFEITKYRLINHSIYEFTTLGVDGYYAEPEQTMKRLNSKILQGTSVFNIQINTKTPVKFIEEDGAGNHRYYAWCIGSIKGNPKNVFDTQRVIRTIANMRSEEVININIAA